MKFSVDGLKNMQLVRIPFGEGAHILQIIISPNTNLTLHRSLVGLLKQGRDGGGVMDVEVFSTNEGHPNESEIRLPDGLELEVIDLARLCGHIVIQTE